MLPFNTGLSGRSDHTSVVVRVCELPGHGERSLIERPGGDSASKVGVGVELCRREGGGALYTIYVKHPGEGRSLGPGRSLLTRYWLRNVSRGGGRSQRPVQLGPVALVDAGDVAVVRHYGGLRYYGR